MFRVCIGIDPRRSRLLGSTTLTLTLALTLTLVTALGTLNWES